MKPKEQNSITLEAITDQLDKFDLPTARLNLADSIGASMTVTGTIEKIKCAGSNKIVINSQMKIFAHFEPGNFDSAKLHKGSRIVIIGKLQSFGYDAVNLIDCC